MSIPGSMKRTVWGSEVLCVVWSAGVFADHHNVGTFSPWTFQMARTGLLKSAAGLTVEGVVMLGLVEKEWRKRRLDELVGRK